MEECVTDVGMKQGRERASGSAEPHPAPHRGNVPPAALWFGLSGAPAVWSIQLMVNYATVAHSCYPRAVPLSTSIFGALWATVLAVNLLTLAGALAAGGTALWTWHRTKSEKEGRKEALLEVGEGRTRFMAFAGILVSALFLIGILFNAATLFVIPPCTYGA